MLDTIIISVLTAVSVGGFLVARYYMAIRGEHQFTKRLQSISELEGDAKSGALEATYNKGRRRSIEKSLKELDDRQKEALSRRHSLGSRLRLAGVKTTKRSFYLISFSIALTLILFFSFIGFSPLLAGPLGVLCGYFLPRRAIAYLISRRLGAFTKAFPTGIDIISRGLRSGLPVSECIKIASTETNDPVRSEFRAMVQDLTIGLSMENTALRFASRVPLSEANFFSTIMASQSKTGGSLSEALLNLSEVLRDRQNMKEKIKAMSSEVVASATIIGLMPLVVTALVYLANPSYIEVLYQTKSGILILIVSALWMLTGVWVIRKMINFDF